MTWEIVVGIIALAGFVGTIAGWASKLSKTLTTLDATIQTLKETIEHLRRDNKESHKEFHQKLDNHEGRITRLESRNEEKSK